jgi:hypothetical protein
MRAAPFIVGCTTAFVLVAIAVAAVPPDLAVPVKLRESTIRVALSQSPPDPGVPGSLHELSRAPRERQRYSEPGCIFAAADWPSWYCPIGCLEPQLCWARVDSGSYARPCVWNVDELRLSCQAWPGCGDLPLPETRRFKMITEHDGVAF